MEIEDDQQVKIFVLPSFNLVFLMILKTGTGLVKKGREYVELGYHKQYNLKASNDFIFTYQKNLWPLKILLCVRSFPFLACTSIWTFSHKILKIFNKIYCYVEQNLMEMVGWIDPVNALNNQEGLNTNIFNCNQS